MKNQRNLRQADVVPQDQLDRQHVNVIGVGALGRQLALQLAAMGTRRMGLIDFDIVEPINLGCQGYRECDLGKLKVEATAELCRELNSEIEIDVRSRRFQRSMDIDGVVFVAVDDIGVRRLIWESVGQRASFFADGRMAAEIVRVLTVADNEGRDHYPQTLFDQREAFQAPCTARSTIFAANIAAGLMLEQFARWLRQIPLDKDLSFNLLASELTVA